MRIFYYVVIPVAILATSFSISRSSNNRPSFIVKSNLPIYTENDFSIDVITTNNRLPIYSLLICQITIDNEVKEEHALHPGFLKGLPRRLFGDYLIVRNYSVRPGIVSVVLGFQERANGAQLELVFLETDSRAERDRVTRNIDSRFQYKLGSVKVSLLLHWRLQVSQHTLDHRNGALIRGSIGMLKCTATGGSPFSLVTFIGTDSLARQRLTLVDGQNEAQLTFHTRIEDHWRKVGCRAGKDETYDRLRVFHHPTKIKLIPSVYGYVSNDTKISCNATDGYPTPTVKWVWVAGPEHSEFYFKIKENVLHILKNAPLQSHWKFECVATNTIPNSFNRGKMKMISFIIGERPVPYVLICSVVFGSILLLIFIAIGIYVILFRNDRTSTEHSSTITSGQNTDQDQSTDIKLLSKPAYPVDEV